MSSRGVTSKSVPHQPRSSPCSAEGAVTEYPSRREAELSRGAAAPRLLHESRGVARGRSRADRSEPDKAVPNIRPMAERVLELSRASGADVRACQALVGVNGLTRRFPYPARGGRRVARRPRVRAGSDVAGPPGAAARPYVATTRRSRTGVTCRVRTLRIADEGGVDGHRNVAGAAPAGGPWRAGPATCAPWWPPPRWKSAPEGVET
jgi:hypothetical protein